MLAYHALVGAKQQRVTVLAFCLSAFQGVLSQ